MKLLIVDGHALAYRSYYAMIKSPLTNSRGENTSAEFGFVRTLRAVLREQAPDALLVCFDPRGKTFRHERYPEYKASRAKTPEELHESIERITGFLDAAGYAWQRREGFEADDVMASAARSAAEDGWDVLLFTGDKDLCQLVDDRVHVLRPAVGQKPARALDVEAVREEFGVRPERLLDYLSLVGDSSDNVPGVAGLGPKSALKLFESHDGLDAVYEALAEIQPAGMQKKLTAGRESAFLSRELIRLVTDLDLDVGREEWELGEPADPEALREWLIDRDFHTLLALFETGGGEEEAVEYQLVADGEELAAMLAELAGAMRLAVDTETTGLDSHTAELVGISLCAVAGRAFYLPVAGQCEGEALALAKIAAALGLILADPAIEKVAQNLKYDSRILARHGMPMAGPCYDTMLASYCVDPSRRSHGLDNLALELLGHEMIPYDSLFEQADKERDIRKVPLAVLGRYAAEDADYTLRLAEHFDPALAEAGVEGLFRKLEMPLVPVLLAMEEAGVALDVGHLERLSERMAAKREELTARIHEAAGREFKIGSPKQLAVVLFEEMGLPPGKKTKTGFSTDEEVLGELAGEHPIAGWVLEWRELSKLKSTYVDVLPTMVSAATGRVHTRFNQAVAATGRLSSSDPNLQNIPIRSELGREIRQAFVAPEGSVLASFDYSQVELRILAHLSGDEALREAFASGRDIHRWTAARLAGKGEDEVSREERDRSKVVNYGVLYGMGARGLAQRLRIPRGEAQQFIDEYFASFPGIRGWTEETLAQARVDGAVSTLLGRRRALPEIHSSNGRIRGFAERVAVNTPIQGTAADLIKRAMIRLHARAGDEAWAARMLLQVHDELLFEIPRADLDGVAAAVVEIMEGVAELAVPLAVDWGAGKNWLEAH